MRRQIHWGCCQTPQTKSLPWIHTCKTGRPNSFGYESEGSLQAHTEARTAFQAPASSVVANQRLYRLYGANMSAERTVQAALRFKFTNVLVFLRML